MSSTITAGVNDLLFDRILRKQEFEESLWNAADQLRSKAKLKSSEYASPMLGLFFLRYASNRFDRLTPQALVDYEATKDSRNAETIEAVYLRLCGYYLPEAARFDTLMNLSGEDNAIKAVKKAMEAFEQANPGAGIELPKNDYEKIPDATLRKILAEVARITMAEGDSFGKIYEYFLGKFALSEGQKGGEFYTPTSVVKLIVEILEPHEGRIFDPACGTGGMFVQSAKFIRSHSGTNHVSIYGQEKVKETSNLAKINLFVNGLKGDIRNVDTSLAAAAYVEKYADTEGKFDYVMANPPFNVDGVAVDDIDGHPLFAHYGLPVSAAKSGKKADAFSNANYLWVSLFATALNPTGRAGFVMANSASDARGGEAEVRKNLVNSGIVDVMVTVSSNFFYTVTLPVTVWFFDKAKTDAQHPNHDRTLFIDARSIYYQTSRSTRAFTEAQLMNLTSIVWLYRGETAQYDALRQRYQLALTTWRDHDVTTGAPVRPDDVKTYRGVQSHQCRVADAFGQLGSSIRFWLNTIDLLLTDEARQALTDNPTFAATLDVLTTVTPDALPDKAAISALYKRADEAVTFADKSLRPDKVGGKPDATFKKADLRGWLRKLATERDDLLFVLERVAYFESQLHWQDSHFPDGQYRDVEGLCKLASRADIAGQQYSLNPGRYVGVALEDDGRTDEEFRDFMHTQTNTLTTLHTEADQLQQQIETDMTFLFLDVNAEETV
ncbi:type I restriction-modification system subunit M [Spirosoma rhododendri]|uniref:site-specific DNA-methyltransferase (adenine-specific) n=1 Tax=Spirosoma rhododendri TaxID=2728024 RepID=A0A7L5DST0_9BACT|nr:class I SAM-dependent DNA methyltransferase [Spirosoma rhododendri]QJD81539.1 SAM-dependent DNA methyltransferase [Spirosoma rhododendri]